MSWIDDLNKHEELDAYYNSLVRENSMRELYVTHAYNQGLIDERGNMTGRGASFMMDQDKKNLINQGLIPNDDNLAKAFWDQLSSVTQDRFASYANSLGFDNTAEAIRHKLEINHDYDPTTFREHPVRRFVELLGQGIGEMAPAIAATAILKSPVPVVADIYTRLWGDNLDKIAEAPADLNPIEAIGVNLALTGIQTATEFGFGVEARAASLIGKNINPYRSLAEFVKTGANRSFLRRMGSEFLEPTNPLTGAIVGAVQETFEESVQNATELITLTSLGKTPPTDKQIVQSLFVDPLQAIPAGMLFGAFGYAHNKAHQLIGPRPVTAEEIVAIHTDPKTGQVNMESIEAEDAAFTAVGKTLQALPNVKNVPALVDTMRALAWSFTRAARAKGENLMPSDFIESLKNAFIADKFDDASIKGLVDIINDTKVGPVQKTSNILDYLVKRAGEESAIYKMIRDIDQETEATILDTMTERIQQHVVKWVPPLRDSTAKKAVMERVASLIKPIIGTAKGERFKDLVAGKTIAVAIDSISPSALTEDLYARLVVTPQIVSVNKRRIHVAGKGGYVVMSMAAKEEKLSKAEIEARTKAEAEVRQRREKASIPLPLNKIIGSDERLAISRSKAVNTFGNYTVLDDEIETYRKRAGVNIGKVKVLPYEVTTIKKGEVKKQTVRVPYGKQDGSFTEPRVSRTYSANEIQNEMVQLLQGLPEPIKTEFASELAKLEVRRVNSIVRSQDSRMAVEIDDNGWNVTPEDDGFPQDFTDNKYVSEQSRKLRLSIKPDTGGRHVKGRKYTKPARTYDEGKLRLSPEGKNVWVRQTPRKSNHGRILLVQISNELINPPAGTVDESYNDKIYTNREGYSRPRDFWELPLWIANAAYSLPNADVYVVRDIAEAQKFLTEAEYDQAWFSAVDVNSDIIKSIAEGTSQKIVVGGYVNPKSFEDNDNITFMNSLPEAVEATGNTYATGTDYRHFLGSSTIPRLVLSSGCFHTCTYCTVENQVLTVDPRVIQQQVESFKALNSQLVYVNDKTFGQAKNHRHLANIYQTLKESNPEFKGFIIQTTASTLIKLDTQFLQDAGIKYVELGVESVNDDILKKNRKPANIAVINQAVNKLRAANIALIPNIMIGLPDETAETYANTLRWLEENRDIISHVNIFNYAAYAETEAGRMLAERYNLVESDFDENVRHKTWHDDPEVIDAFADALYSFGNSVLDNVRFKKGLKLSEIAVLPYGEWTKEFQKKFKFSKVRARDGSLLVQYHGSPNFFWEPVTYEETHNRRMATSSEQIFDTGGKFDMRFDPDLGFHFGTSLAANNAINYLLEGVTPQPITGQQLIPVYLNITNPIVLKDDLKIFRHAQSWENYIARHGNRGFNGLTEKHFRILGRLPMDQQSEAIRELLISKGFDGIQYRNEIEDPESTSWVVIKRDTVYSALLPDWYQRPLFSIVGEDAVHNLGIAKYETPLIKAKRMYEKGKPMLSILKETGWFLGKEGKWKFEVSDEKFVLNVALFVKKSEDSIFTGRTVYLKDIMHHPDLFALYPELKDVPVIMSVVMGTVNHIAVYNHAKNEIRVNRKIFFPETDAEKNYVKNLKEHDLHGNFERIFIHEIQHYIQAKEYFGYGSSANAEPIEIDVGGKLKVFFRNEVTIADAVTFLAGNNMGPLMIARSLLKDHKSEVESLFKDKMDVNFYTKLRKLIQITTQNKGPKYEFYFEHSKSIFSSDKRIFDIIELLGRVIIAKKTTLEEIEKELDWMSTLPRTPRQVYDHSAGEIEADLVEDRIKLTAKQRRALPFILQYKIPLENQWVMTHEQMAYIKGTHVGWELNAKGRPEMYITYEEEQHAFKHPLFDLKEMDLRGLYLPQNNLTLFFKNADEATVLHEFLHHAKSLLPASIQAELLSVLDKSGNGIWDVHAEEAFVDVVLSYIKEGHYAGKSPENLRRGVDRIIPILKGMTRLNSVMLTPDVKKKLDDLFSAYEETERSGIDAESATSSLGQNGPTAEQIIELLSTAAEAELEPKENHGSRQARFGHIFAIANQVDSAHASGLVHEMAYDIFDWFTDHSSLTELTDGELKRLEFAMVKKYDERHRPKQFTNKSVEKLIEFENTKADVNRDRRIKYSTRAKEKAYSILNNIRSLIDKHDVLFTSPKFLAVIMDNFANDGPWHRFYADPIDEMQHLSIASLHDMTAVLHRMVRKHSLDLDRVEKRRVNLAGYRGSLGRAVLLAMANKEVGGKISEAKKAIMSSNHITEQEFQDATDFVNSDAEAQAFMAYLAEAYEYLYNQIAPVYKRINGENLKKVPNYFALLRLDGMFSEDDDVVRAMEFVNQYGQSKAASRYTMLKHRTARKAGHIDLDNALAGLRHYTAQSANYISKAEIVRDMSEKLNTYELQEAILRSHGEERGAALYDVIREMLAREMFPNARMEIMGDADRFFAWTRQSFTMSMLGFRPLVWIAQLASKPTFYSLLKGGLSIRTFFSDAANTAELTRILLANQGINLHREYTGDFREQGYNHLLEGSRLVWTDEKGHMHGLWPKYARHILESHGNPVTGDIIQHGFSGILKKTWRGISWGERAMLGITTADMLTVGSTWLTAFDLVASKEFQKHGNKRLAEREAARVANDLIAKTQPPRTQFQRPKALTSREGFKLLFPFSGQTIQNWQLWLNSVVRPSLHAIASGDFMAFFKGKSEYESGIGQRLLLGFVLPAIILCFRALRREPTKEELTSFIMFYPIAAIPAIGGTLSYMFTREKEDAAVEIAPTLVINRILQATYDIAKTATGDKKFDKWDLRTMEEALAIPFSVPTAAVRFTEETVKMLYDEEYEFDREYILKALSSEPKKIVK